MSAPPQIPRRPADLDRLYDLLASLSRQVGEPRRLADGRGLDPWPERGVYFFFEGGELREDGRTPRVVRVGTHGLRAGSRSTLWGRMAQHRGTPGGRHPGGGNHRGSVFRLHVGSALIAAGDPAAIHAAGTWAVGSTRPPEADQGERALEQAVSRVIGAMPYLCLPVADPPGPRSARGPIEANAIALLSNRGRPPLDPPSGGWLGHQARSAAVRESGLWNSNHVDQAHGPAFLDIVAALVEAAPANG